jgi:hypothetical protein
MKKGHNLAKKITDYLPETLKCNPFMTINMYTKFEENSLVSEKMDLNIKVIKPSPTWSWQ